MEAASSAPEVPKQKEIQGVLLGRCDVGKLIGQESFAKVYYARNVRIGESVAIKVIDKKKILKIGLIAHIKRELKGGELFNKVAKGMLKEEVARKYFQQLISAVAFCHARGVYHCDLKLENILLNEDGSLKVSDFGLSAISEQIKHDSLFHTFCGTPAYAMAEPSMG